MLRMLKLVPLLFISVLSGCAGLTNSTSFREMSSAYREVLEQYANDNVLLNIVRASKSMPVSFLDMPSVMGSGSVSNSVQAGPSIYGVAPGSSLAGFFTPTGGSGVSAGVSLAVNNSFNFTQSSLDNSSFMVSFLSDLKPAAIASLSNSQLATRDVLFSLAIESIEGQDPQGKTLVKFYNDPYSPKFIEFQRTLFNLVRAGITVEQTQTMMPVSAPMDAETVNRNLQGVATAQSIPMTALVPTKLPGGRDGFQLMRMMPPDARICLEQKAADEQLSFRVAQSAYCKSSKASGGAVDTSKPEVTLIIKLRSVRNVFEFLGALVNIQNGAEPRMITVVDSEKMTANATMEQILAQSKPLFVVKKGTSSGDNIMTVAYQGTTYSVPKDDKNATYTNQVLAMLSQMLTLTKVPGSIPLSPAVLIK
ncbi:MAG: hypothetical protein WCG12_02125 [Alcaligenaceae bacterium]